MTGSKNRIICSQYCNEGLGECTEFSSCSNSTVFHDGSHQINIRFNVELETNACHYLEMCCDPEDVIDAHYVPPIVDGYPAFVPTDSHNSGNQGEDQGRNIGGNQDRLNVDQFGNKKPGNNQDIGDDDYSGLDFSNSNINAGNKGAGNGDHFGSGAVGNQHGGNENGVGDVSGNQHDGHGNEFDVNHINPQPHLPDGGKKREERNGHLVQVDHVSHNLSG